MNVFAPALRVVVLMALPFRASADAAAIWHSTADSIAVQSDPAAAPKSCLSGKAYSTPDEGDGDYLKILPNKWHSGTILFGKKATGYFCKLGDGSRPNLGAYASLTFLARASGFDAAAGCEPRIDFYGGSWPRKTSNSIVLKGGYVDRGELVADEYRRVVVPTDDLKTAEFPLDQIQRLTFRNCAGTSGQRYDVRGVEMTDDPPAVIPGGGGGGGGAPPTATTGAPTSSPTGTPATPDPTTSPTKEPTPAPTEAPTEGPTPAPQDLAVYEGLADGHSAEGSHQSCLYFADKGITAQVSDPADGDYLVVDPDPWRSGGLSFGCLAGGEGSCTHSCFQNGYRPDFSPYAALSFLAKLENGDALSEGCQPRLKLYGGGSPAAESETVVLGGTYVDEGFLVADEWRQVVIPLSDLTNAWNLDGAKTLRFLTCGSDASTQPLYKAKNIRATNSPPAVRSQAPTTSPTVRVTQDPSVATHFYYLNGWYPLVDKEAGTWLHAENGAWPEILAGAQDGEYSVAVPAGSHVLYSGTSTAAKLNHVVVEDGGSLEIAAEDGASTSLTLGTLRVDEGGTLVVRTDAAPSSNVDIVFDGDVDRDADPTELLHGLVSFGGNVAIDGAARCGKMEEIADAMVGSSSLTLVGTGAADCWRVGDEIILPDTQVGLDIDYDFIPNGYDHATDSQLETVRVTGLQAVGDLTLVHLEYPLSFDHRAGAHAAMVSRSVVLRTAPGSSARGHVLHTGYGAFDVRNARVEEMGRAGTQPFNSTTLEVDGSIELAEGLGKMVVTKWGDNQVARYALHAHHSMVPMEFSGNAIVGGLRFGIVAHNSRVSILDNVVVGVEGTAVLLEDGTETGDVRNNYVIGTGQGSGESDSARFTPSQGTEFGHGGFAIWSRTAYAAIEDNVAEGVFGESPYAFFLHINFMEHRRVPDVEGTPAALVGRTRSEVRYDVHGGALSLNTYGSFRANRCTGSWKRAFRGDYFLMNPPEQEGHVLEDFDAVALGVSGAGFAFGHSSRFTVTGSLTAVAEGNSVVGVSVANGNLTFHDCDFSYTGVDILRSGCMECYTGLENCNVFG